MFLAGDIGGTKTHLAFFENEIKTPTKTQKYVSKDFSSLSEIVKEFTKETQTVEKAAFGIAGPVSEGVCKTTNLPWTIDSKDLAKELKTDKVALLNDLEANAWGIKVLSEEDFYVLNQGKENPKNNQALVSAGTGLGEAGLYFDGKLHRPFACEGGHCDFSPRNEREIELFRYLNKQFGHVSYERILSGPGLENVYQFLLNEKELDKKKLEAKKISEKALEETCPICEEALDLFISIYGSEAGNAALKFFALGGVFIGGGIAPKLIDRLKDKDFMTSFVNKGRFESLLKDIPVKVILNPLTALFGAGYFAKECL